jgi:hypothetical protein
MTSPCSSFIVPPGRSTTMPTQHCFVFSLPPLARPLRASGPAGDVVACCNSRWSSSLIALYPSPQERTSRCAASTGCCHRPGDISLPPTTAESLLCCCVVLRTGHTHLGSQRPRHIQAIGADRVPAGSTEQHHPDWFPFVTKTSALISFPPRPGSVTTADVACLRAAGGGYSRHLCLTCRATGN